LETLRMARCIGPGSYGGRARQVGRVVDRVTAVRGAADGGVSANARDPRRGLSV
jgi:hypothetical protein